MGSLAHSLVQEVIVFQADSTQTMPVGGKALIRECLYKLSNGPSLFDWIQRAWDMMFPHRIFPRGNEVAACGHMWACGVGIRGAEARGPKWLEEAWRVSIATGNSTVHIISFSSPLMELNGSTV